MADKRITKKAYQENPAPVGTLQEKQLEELDGNFDRKRPEHTEDLPTTERQLDDVPVTTETGNSEFQLDKKIKDGLSDRFERLEQNDLPLPEDDNRLGDKRENDVSKADKQVGERQLEGKDNDFDFKRWDDESRDGKQPVTKKQFEGRWAVESHSRQTNERRIRTNCRSYKS